VRGKHDQAVAADLIARLAANERIRERVALVVAHPDDETVGVGSRLHLFDDLTLIHVTDGTPDGIGFARRAGFPDNAAYAAARRAELDAALVALGAAPRRRSAYGLGDQRAHEHLPAPVAGFPSNIAGNAAGVVTHAYEHGHPDHDTAALAVSRAQRLALRHR
jgi:LmbE family N-acetylglucosaminyl deacetylase